MKNCVYTVISLKNIKVEIKCACVATPKYIKVILRKPMEIDSKVFTDQLENHYFRCNS